MRIVRCVFVSAALAVASAVVVWTYLEIGSPPDPTPIRWPDLQHPIGRGRPVVLPPVEVSTGRAMDRLQPRFDACAREHGGAEGQWIEIAFSIDPTGAVTRTVVWPLYGCDRPEPPYPEPTAVELCVAQQIETLGRFTRSRRGIDAIVWSVVLHPDASGRAEAKRGS